MTSRPESSGDPRKLVVGFCCNECAYAAADLAGSTHRTHPPNVLVVRVPCSGAVDPSWLLYALANGADAVFVAGCRRGECHYVDGNLKAEARVSFLKSLLEAVGVEPERVEMFFMAASEPHKFVEAAREMAARVERLPPLHRRESVPVGPKRDVLIRALQSIAVEVRDVQLPAVPGFEVPVFDLEKCIGCRACVEACPNDALRSEDSGDYRVFILSALRCTGCGDCVDACRENEVEALSLGGVRVPQLLSEWSEVARVELVRCSVCGRPFATERELERADSPPICPDCKAKASAKAISFGRVRW